MNRRNFLTRSGLALGALIVGDAALEELARLTHVRKSFPSAGVARPMTATEALRNQALAREAHPFTLADMDALISLVQPSPQYMFTTRRAAAAWRRVVAP